MASIYPKKRSPFWHIEYREALTGKKRNESTKLRRNNRDQTRKARQLCAQRTADELAAAPTRSGDDWQVWVPAFLAARYQHPLTKLRVDQAWVAVSAYLRAKGISNARVLTREHCTQYLTWRTNAEIGKAIGLRKAKHNTALLEMKFLSTIMREAVLRGKASANPCLQLGIGRVKVTKKPEITEEQMKVIERRLKAERDYQYNEAMQIAWDVAIRYARRIRATCVPLEDVDLREGTITFYNKGGEKKTKLLHPELVPLFRRLKRTGRKFAYDMPPNFSKVWWYFFRRCGFPQLSFHSVRITCVNILRRKGVDPRISRDYVDHSSVIVHEGYERWRPEDHAAAVRALARGRASSASNARGRKR